jgi:SpoIID/LytB domain protein
MPFAWPLEALKAQAVAARSYALKNLVQGKPFDLYSDVRSQVYGGMAVEQDATSRAVQATAGQVVTYGGELASTLYFSSSGGRTASAADVFGTTVPYLVSRSDPWDKVSPYHTWGPVVIGARTLQAKLGVTGRVFDATSVPTPSGRLRSLVLETQGGRTAVQPTLVRTALELRSTWVSVGVLRLDRPRGAVEHGSPLELSGIARKVASPRLSVAAGNGTWVPADDIERAPDGSFSSEVKPVRTTRYRLEAAASPKVAGQALLVRVAPRVRLARPVQPGVLAGIVRPRLAGALVSVERQQGTAWMQVGQTATDGAGNFRLELDLLPGVYRARVAATGDFAEGVSPSLTVDR